MPTYLCGRGALETQGGVVLRGADAELRSSPVGAAAWALRDAVWQQPLCTGCRLAYQPGCQAIWWARHWQEPSHESPD